MAKVYPNQGRGSGGHCESCGQENPHTHSTDSYTECCNELVCYGGYKSKFGFPNNFVRACCWAKAEEEFRKLGKRSETGMSKLD